MKLTKIQRAIQKIDAEIALLEQVRDRLALADADAPKRRKPKPAKKDEAPS